MDPPHPLPSSPSDPPELLLRPYSSSTLSPPPLLSGRMILAPRGSYIIYRSAAMAVGERGVFRHSEHNVLVGPVGVQQPSRNARPVVDVILVLYQETMHGNTVGLHVYTMNCILS